MTVLTSSSQPSPTSSTHLSPLALYHVIRRLQLWNPCWKRHHLTRIFWKKYRRISNLPFLSKILEKVVLHKRLSHLQANNPCNPFQSVYRAGHSSETVLLRVVNDTLSALDNDNISVLLLLDLSAAFLSSPASALFLVFSLLHSNGLSHISLRDVSSLQWITHPRHHRSSRMVCLRARCWGPFSLSSTLHSSDIIGSHSVNHQSFADGTQLQIFAPLSDIDNLTKKAPCMQRWY